MLLFPSQFTQLPLIASISDCGRSEARTIDAGYNKITTNIKDRSNSSRLNFIICDSNFFICFKDALIERQQNWTCRYIQIPEGVLQAPSQKYICQDYC